MTATLRDWRMKTDETWLDRVLNLAESRGIPQRRLVEAAGVEPARVAKWRDGSKPTLQNVMGIAQLLDVSLDWIATGAAPAAGYPKDPLTDEERHLLWMLRTIGVTPEQAAAKVATAAQAIEAPGPVSVEVRGVRTREVSTPPDRDPAGADLDDAPAPVLPRVQRGR